MSSEVNFPEHIIEDTAAFTTVQSLHCKAKAEPVKPPQDFLHVGSIWRLPLDLRRLILSRLDLQSLLACRLVCRTFESICYRSTPKILLPKNFTAAHVMVLFAMFPSLRVLQLNPDMVTSFPWDFIHSSFKAGVCFDLSLISNAFMLNDFANTILRLRLYSMALPFANRCIELAPLESFYWNNRAFIYQHLSRYEAALSDIETAMKLSPGYATYHNSKGLQLCFLGRLDESIAEFTTAITLNPADDIFWNNRGLAYYKQGSYQEAYENYSQSLHLNPYVDAIGLYNRGRALQQLGRLDEAKADFQKSLEGNRDDLAVHYRYGKVLELLNKQKEALDLFKDALERKLTPKDAEDFHALGQMYQRFDRHDEAIEALDQAIQLQPHNPEYYEARAKSMEALGRVGGMLMDRDKALVERLKMMQQK